MFSDYEKFKRDVYQITRIDLDSYKEKQMKRRINTLITKNRIDSYDTYVNAIKSDKQMLEEFVNFLTINVSEFFRNGEQWGLLEAEVIPELMKRHGKRLKIWSAACSTGDEPYTLVMMLSKYLPLDHISIIATDIDKQVLAKAKAGIYSERSINGVPSEFKDKFFVKDGSSYVISDKIKKRVEFRQHDLLKDSYPSSCHLIVCRNVLIYFTEEAKEEIYKKFNKALANDGVLFIGSTEQIMNYKELNYIRRKSFFFQKT